MSPPANVVRKFCTCEKSSVILATILLYPLRCMKTIWHVWLCLKILCVKKFSRHIDIRRYFVCDLVAHSIMKLEPLRTHFMVADALTKSLPAPAHAKHRDVIIGRVPFCVRTLRSAFSVVGG